MQAHANKETGRRRVRIRPKLIVQRGQARGGEGAKVDYKNMETTECLGGRYQLGGIGCSGASNFLRLGGGEKPEGGGGRRANAGGGKGRPRPAIVGNSVLIRKRKLDTSNLTGAG